MVIKDISDNKLTNSGWKCNITYSSKQLYNKLNWTQIATYAKFNTNVDLSCK